MTTTHWILTATGRDFPLSGLPTVINKVTMNMKSV